MQTTKYQKKYPKLYNQKNLQQSFSQSQFRSYSTNPIQNRNPKNSKITHKTIYGEKYDYGEKQKEKQNYVLYVSGAIQDKKEVVEVENIEEKKPIQQIFSKKEIIDNYKYHESKYIKKNNPNKKSITLHERLSKPVERNIFSEMSNTTKISTENKLSNVSSENKIIYHGRIKSSDWNNLLRIVRLENCYISDKNNNKIYENNIFNDENNIDKSVVVKKVVTKTINNNCNDSCNDNYNDEFNNLYCKNINNNFDNNNFANNKEYVNTYSCRYRGASYDENKRNIRKERNCNFNNLECEEFENNMKRRAKSKRTCACGKIVYE